MNAKNKIKRTASDLSEAADAVAQFCERSSSGAPRMKKEITVRSSYYSSKAKKHPCAETLFQLDIDCSLLKLALLIALGAVILWVMCSNKRKRCNH
jgi:hypothetical protein